MSSGRTPASPAALRIWPVISSNPVLEIGCGVSASGSKKIGSSGPASRPNFSRNFRSCSWMDRSLRFSLKRNGLRLAFLATFEIRHLLTASFILVPTWYSSERGSDLNSWFLAVQGRYKEYLCPSVLKRLLRYMQKRPLPCKLLFLQ